MSRRSVTIMASEGHHYPRQSVWAAITTVARKDAAATVSARALADQLGLNCKTVSDYLLSLTAGGYLDRVCGQEIPARAAQYRLKRDAGHHAPRLRRDGSPVTQGAGTANMWRSMHIKGSFSALDLAVHATTDTVNVSEATAQSYCSMLARTGYLRVVEKADPGRGRKAVYKLVRYTGPRPPMIQRIKQVFDQNTQEVYRPGENT
ncbi:MAG: hypothetical protein JJU24_05225 [Natronohydrobacter sp.]|nr:hypothetical protein [Natronohydrobacter sp.]